MNLYDFLMFPLEKIFLADLRHFLLPQAAGPRPGNRRRLRRQLCQLQLGQRRQHDRSGFADLRCRPA